jgi:hypothetical protein
MPIVKPTPTSAPVFYPETDYVIVKYFDLTKFVSLIQRQSLFFCRLDKLEDKFEGTTAKANFEDRVSWYKYLRDVKRFFTVPLSDDQIIEHVKKQYEVEKKMKSLNCVNCWNRSDEESVALWKIYSDFNKGIMIKSSISRLEKSFEQSQKEVLLSEVRYLDYENETMPDGNLMYPILHKQNAYSYEHEVRLIHVISRIGLTYDWESQEIEEGIYIKSNLDQLITEIIISPYAPKWFFKLVEELTQKYGLNSTIKKSKLSILK